MGAKAKRAVRPVGRTFNVGVMNPTTVAVDDDGPTAQPTISGILHGFSDGLDILNHQVGVLYAAVNRIAPQPPRPVAGKPSDPAKPDCVLADMRDLRERLMNLCYRLTDITQHLESVL